jgi:hypothetical protein
VCAQPVDGHGTSVVNVSIGAPEFYLRAFNDLLGLLGLGPWLALGSTSSVSVGVRSSSEADCETKSKDHIKVEAACLGWRVIVRDVESRSFCVY